MKINIQTILLLAAAGVVSYLYGAVAMVLLLAAVFIIGLISVANLAATVCSDPALGSGSTAYQIAAMLVMNVMQSSFSGGRADVAFLGATARETQLLERLRRSPAYGALSTTVSLLGPVPVFPGYLILSTLGR